jgi:site-specific recombinase XerD
METPGSASQAFETYLLTTGKSPETARTYVASLRTFERWALEREIAPQIATQPHVAAFLASQLRQVSLCTARNRLLALRAFYGFLRVREGRADNPTLGLAVKKPQSLPKAPLALPDQRRLVFGCRSVRDEAMLMVLIDTGVRVGELSRMRIENVRWPDGTILVDGKGNKQREVWVGEATLLLLRQVAGVRVSGPLWLTKDGYPMSRDRVRKNFYNLARRVRVHAHPHQIRATFANRFLSEGGNLDELQVAMGHSDISTTAHYAAATRQTRALDQMRRLNLASRLLA